MAKVSDILRDHESRIRALEQQVADLLSGQDPFEEDVDLGDFGPAEAAAELDAAGFVETPAARARARGWDPETYLAEGEDAETTDGAVIMARREVCERTEEHINAEVRRAEFEGVPEGPVPEDEFLSTVSGQTVGLPRPSAEAKLAWAETADAVIDHIPADFGLTVEAAKDAYRKGGPLWLAMYDHDYVMSLPYAYRQKMAESVIEYAPVAGTDLANDILRLDTAASQDFAHTQIEGGAAE